MSLIQEAYAKHKNLKLAAAELGMPWQILYANLKKEGVDVTGDKLRYGSDRDKLSALAEDEFSRLVPSAKVMNQVRWQYPWDFEVGDLKIDVKASMPRQLNKKYPATSWAFSFKKQSLTCDFIVCFCFGVDKAIQRVLLVPKEFFMGLQTVSVSCEGNSKWLDYAVEPGDLSSFFSSLAPAEK